MYKETFHALESVRKYSSVSIIYIFSTNKVYGDLEYIKYEERKTRYEALSYPSGFNIGGGYKNNYSLLELFNEL